MYIKEKTLGENYKDAFELWRERNPVMRINTDATLFLNQINYILKAKGITPVEIDETKEVIRLKIWKGSRGIGWAVPGSSCYREVTLVARGVFQLFPRGYRCRL
jgi:hypothetical protein